MLGNEMECRDLETVTSLNAGVVYFSSSIKKPLLYCMAVLTKSVRQQTTKARQIRMKSRFTCEKKTELLSSSGAFMPRFHRPS